MVSLRFAPTAVATAIATLLTACGGGSDDTSSGPPPAATTLLTTKVLDGAIRDALVCFDLNDNAACDAGEPSARSAADGATTLVVEQAQLGLHGLVAVVGTDAVDADHGPIAQAFVLTAPPTRTEAITPLSTLVARKAAAEGLTAEDAEAALRDDGGLDHALTGDFSTLANSASRGKATALARAVLLAMQAAKTTLAPAVGRLDRSGIAMTQAALDAAAVAGVSTLLDALGEAARASALDTTSTPAVRDAALKGSVDAAMAARFTLTPANVGLAIEAALPADRSAHAATGGSTVAWLAFTDAANWSYREFRSTVAQDTPDANGLVRYTEARRQSVGGVATNWGESAAFTRNDVYWTGSRWFACPVDHVHQQTIPNALGVRTSTYCDALVSSNTRRTVDIAGKTMASVVADIRAYPLPSTGGVYAQWGPDPASGVLGTAVFPAGSTLRHQTTVQVANADAYNPSIAGNAVAVYGSDVAAGVPAACNVTQTATPATTLEQMVAANPGTPCVYGANATVGPRNEWWGNSTLSLNAGVPAATPSLPFYAASRSIRVAFTGGNTVQYLSCARQASNNSPRNCDKLGTGTYAIETRGDGRALVLTNQPIEAAPSGHYRVFVEREGKVWYGYRTRLATDHAMRLNGIAGDALFAQIGVTR